jgi:hypothetical protein
MSRKQLRRGAIVSLTAQIEPSLLSREEVKGERCQGRRHSDTVTARPYLYVCPQSLRALSKQC